MNKQLLGRVALIGAALLFLVTVRFSGQKSYVIAPQDRYAAILKLIQERAYQQAFVECQRLIETAPQMELAYKRLAEVASVAGFSAEAESFLNNLVASTPVQQALKEYSLAALYSLRATDVANQQRVIEHCQQGLSAAPGFTWPYRMLVDAYRGLGRDEEAKEYLNTLLLRQPNGALVLYGLGYFYRQKNNLAESLNYLDRALALAPDLLDALYLKGSILSRTGKPQDATAALQLSAQILSAAQEKGDLEQQGWAWVIRGNTQHTAGQLPQSIQSYSEGVRLAEAAGGLELRDQSLVSLCASYVRLDDYANGLAACRKVPDSSSKFIEYKFTNLGVAYRRLGDTESGIHYYEQALSLARNKKNTDAQISLMTNLGQAYTDLKRYAEAQKLLNEAIELASRIGDPYKKSSALASLGKLRYEQGNYQRALDIYEESRKLSQSANKLSQTSLSLDSLGEIYTKLNKWDKALQAHHAAWRIGEKIKSARLVWRAQSGMAAIHRQLNHFEQAKQHYLLAIEALEKTRQQLSEEEDKIGFWQDKVRVHKELLALLLDSAKLGKERQAPASREAYQRTAAEAFHLSETWRARAFLDLLAEARIKPADKPLPRAADLASTAPANWPGSTPINLAEAQALLDDQTAVLAYSLGESESFLFVIGHRNFAVHKLANEAAINERASRLIKLLANKQQFLPELYWQEARALSRQLIGPARNQLVGKNQLVIVADGALQRLPFEALLKDTVGQQSTTTFNEWPYLIKEFAISYAPSVSIWANLQAKARQSHLEQKDFIAFGAPLYSEDSSALSQTTRAGTARQLAPLKYSLAEVEKIAALFPRERVALFLGAQANEENVKTVGRLGQFRFLHFSAHTVMNETAPRFSGLLLSAPTVTKDTADVAPQTANYEDGLLTANEIFKLRLNAELVSLSACETGLGKEIKGEGLMGLMRAFIYAGTPSVLVSLWKVDDEAAADQMVRFYRYLLKGKAGQPNALNKAQALQQARLDAIQRGSVPYFWAPFILIGNP